jgi:hypothetical protein
MPAAGKRLPGFGRSLMAKRRAGLVPASRHVWIVDRFNFPKHAQGWQCVVPPGADPGELDFSFVAGLECTIVAATAEALDAIGAAVLAFKPKRLVGCSGEPPAIRIF